MIILKACHELHSNIPFEDECLKNIIKKEIKVPYSLVIFLLRISVIYIKFSKFRVA